MIAMEQTLLGACMLEASAYWRIADLIRPEHFADRKNSAIWTAIQNLAGDGSPFDAVSVADYFDGQSVAPLVGGLKYLADLTSNTHSTANIRSYAESVADSFIARSVRQTGALISTIEGSGAERLAEAQRLIREIDVARGATVTAKDVVRNLVPQMQAQCDAGKELIGLSTGWQHLDRMTMGWTPGTLNIVAGRPSMGKTAFALQSGLHAALSGVGVHVVTLEMSADSCMRRLISAESRVPFESVRNAFKITENEWPRVTDATQRIASAPLTLDDSTYRLEHIVASIRQQAMSRSIGLVVIDYLGYIELPKADRQDLRVQEATRAFKRLAKEVEIPVVLLAQLNRAVDGRASHRPVLSDLRDAGAIEQDADLVLFLHREDYYNADHPTKGFAEAIIAKQRDGMTGPVAFKHRFDVMRFEEAEGLPREEEHKPVRFHRGASGGADRAAGETTYNRRGSREGAEVARVARDSSNGPRNSGVNHPAIPALSELYSGPEMEGPVGEWPGD